ncbi:MAG TPA: DMT family transporter [Ignavibacteria bacterium]|nr:DMT family transporter [Ignavibacteria bacterium]HMR40355.1 DMT family transporter [Ignavibacteria bacterium]
MIKYLINIPGNVLKTYRAEMILLCITIAWGLSFPLVKISLNSISPGLFIFIRFLITLVTFMIIFRNKIEYKNFKLWKNGLILGVFLFSGFAFQTVGLEYTTASKSGFITGTNLIILPFAQFFILKIKPGNENIAGALIVLTGLYILSEAFYIVPNIGDLMTLFCAVFFAIHIILLNKYTSDENFLYMTFGQFFSMTILSLLFTFFYDENFKGGAFIILNTELIITLIYTSFVSTLLSILLITKYQNMTTPLRAGIIYSMESIFAAIFAFLVLNEILNFNQMLGAAIMFTGLLISEFYGIVKLKIKNAYGSKNNS